MQFGFTADQDNKTLPKTLLAGFLDAMDTVITWQTPDQSEVAAFKLRDDLNRLADDLIAATQSWKQGAWVLQNTWSGFPDPAEFLFLGFDGQGQVNATGYFEDWPSYWHRQEQD